VQVVVLRVILIGFLTCPFVNSVAEMISQIP